MQTVFDKKNISFPLLLEENNIKSFFWTNNNLVFLLLQFHSLANKAEQVHGGGSCRWDNHDTAADGDSDGGDGGDGNGAVGGGDGDSKISSGDFFSDRSHQKSCSEGEKADEQQTLTSIQVSSDHPVSS